MKRILITGGDSYLGLMIAERLLEELDTTLALWCRGKVSSEEESECVSIDVNASKIGKIHNKLKRFKDRYEIFFGELTEEKPFSFVDASTITDVLHLAAVTRFNVESELADSVNVEGSRKVFQFASSCKNLRKISYVSTIYSAGLTGGVISESLPSGKDGFSNHYERSKFEAETLLFKEFAQLPFEVYRLATILCHDNSGYVEQYNVVHNTQRILYHGLISMLPGLESTPIYLVTGEFCRDAVVKLFLRNHIDQKIYNVCYSKQESVDNSGFVDGVFQGFSACPVFTRKRIMKPLFASLDVFESMADVLSRGIGGEMVRSALSTIRPYAKQMFIEKDMDVRSIKQRYPEYTPPEMNKLVSATAKFLVLSKWGRVKVVESNHDSQELMVEV